MSSDIPPPFDPTSSLAWDLMSFVIRRHGRNGAFGMSEIETRAEMARAIDAHVAAQVTDTREQRLSGQGVQTRYIRELLADRARHAAALEKVRKISLATEFSAHDRMETIYQITKTALTPPLTVTPPSASSPS